MARKTMTYKTMTYKTMTYKTMALKIIAPEFGDWSVHTRMAYVTSG